MDAILVSMDLLLWKEQQALRIITGNTYDENGNTITEVNTGIADVAVGIAAKTTYYTMNGVPVATPVCGIYIRKAQNADGTVSTSKVVIR